MKVYKVIYHGLLNCFRTKTPRTLSRRTPTILWVSRLIPSKEPNVLLDALKILNATILVHTSSYEPFGFCVLEAMGIALPVIVSRYGGAYEVAGSAAISFNPHDALDFVEKIFTCLQNSENYYNFSLKSLERSKLFTWSRAVMNTWRFIRNFFRHKSSYFQIR